MKPTTTLFRTTFETSRSLEFFTEKELTMQIGFERPRWAEALLKELIDNALDACEAADIPPEITVTVGPESFSVQDNGPGLPVATLERSLDYMVRVSDKAHYISPTRGQLGNALKCVWAAPFVVNGESGRVEIATGGQTHIIDVSLDRIAQEPRLKHTVKNDGFVQIGTFVKVHWIFSSSLQKFKIQDLYKSAEYLCLQYALFNPHAKFLCQEEGGKARTFPALFPAWQKWRPSYPTSAHWYDVDRLSTLIAAYVGKERGAAAKTVREFVSEFDGLKRTDKQKEVTDKAGLSGAYLRDLVEGEDVKRPSVSALLAAMQSSSRPVNLSTLGIIGRNHIEKYLADISDIETSSFRYKKIESTVAGSPYVIEVAFGCFSKERPLVELIGLNWTPALRDPFVRLTDFLEKARVAPSDPVLLAVHVVSPVLNFLNRAKSSVSLSDDIEESLAEAITSVTKTWTKLKKQNRGGRIQQHDFKGQHQRLLNLKEASYQVMEEAYLKASAGGRLPANARQVMYAARPLVLELTGNCWKDSAYFTQQLLPDFVEEHPALAEQWDIVFDARGHLEEPHTGKRIDLGTIDVREYHEAWEEDFAEDVEAFSFDYACPTVGPDHRYAAVLFVEKEGFNPLLKAARIAEKYDLAIMSTKGMSTTAARQLVERLTEKGVKILVLHDFDKSGFSIVHTLRTSTRPNRHVESSRVKSVTVLRARSNLMECFA